jgi:diguanylate cyclase (GGDEF)-like protein
MSMSKDDKHTEEMLKSILNGMDALITVCDPETFEVLFLNDAIRRKFQIESSGVGHKCYKILQGLDKPCHNCPYDSVTLNDVVTWEHHEVKTGAVLHKNAKLIEWPPNKIAHLEYAIDISELRQEQEKNLKLAKEANRIYFDSLTDVYSRLYFDERIDDILKSRSRSNDNVCLMMIDIDLFKNYNDEYGHIMGDHCLKQVAQTIKQSLLRKSDFVARFGGEEFVVVLPDTNENGAKIMAEKILKSIEAMEIPHAKSNISRYITISIGVAVGSRKSKLELLEAADKMLYQSKDEGKNRFNLVNL